jgi:hypothetical protein
VNPDALTVQTSLYPGAPRAFPPLVRLAWPVLTLLSLGVAVLALFAFVPVFWMLLEVAWALADQRRGPGWLPALALATLASWIVMYLLQDRLGALGNAAAQMALMQRIAALLPGETPDFPCFVELRGVRARGVRPDIGWLLFFPDRLEFVGDRQRVTVPRIAVSGPPRLLSTAAGLLPAYLDLPIPSGGRLRLLARGDIARLSETGPGARALSERLVGWLDSDSRKG